LSGEPKKTVEYSWASRALYASAKSLIRWVLVALFRLKVTGRDNEFGSGRVIYASNHVSGIDPPLVGASIRRSVTFLAKKELFDIPILGWFIRAVHARPVDRGGYSRGVLEIMRAQLEADEATLLFPEGTRRRDGKLGEGKIGVGMLAVWTGAPVLPVYLAGTANPMKAFMFRSRLKVVIGRPVLPPVVEGASERKKAYQDVTDKVMSEMARLKSETD
jgi:1-acyl-sn-glycerol-3-phosphate acyltransferase